MHLQLAWWARCIRESFPTHKGTGQLPRCFSYLLPSLDELHCDSLGQEKKLPGWFMARMRHELGSAGAKAARAAVDKRSQALAPYNLASGKTIPRYTGVSYFDTSAKLFGDDHDFQIMLFPAMLDAGILPPELCCALVANCEAASQLRQSVFALVRYSDAVLQPVHNNVVA